MKTYGIGHRLLEKVGMAEVFIIISLLNFITVIVP